MPTRRRSIPTKAGKGHVIVENRYRNKPLVQRITDSYSQRTDFPKGTQVTVSENHPAWRSRKGQSRQDIGGDFSTIKTSIRGTESHGTVTRVLPSTDYDQYSEYTGPILAINPTLVSFPSPIQSTNSALNAWGAKAIANAKPTNALVDLSVALGELLGPGGIPRMIARSSNWNSGIQRALKSSADDYLEVQFGWTPILNDIISFASVVERFNQLVKQYERDAGRVVRRRWSFEPINTKTDTVFDSSAVPFMTPGNSSILSGVSGRVYRRRETSIRRWFSGAFTYFLPTGYSSRNRLLDFGPEARKLLGLEPSPETLWNLAPWSWAVDWFSSAGDVVSNVSDWSTDGLVMPYGYIMEHCVSTDTYMWGKTAGTFAVQPSPITVTRESKVRRKANPFGFGLTWGGLSTRQKSIIAALGISRGL